MRYPLAILLGCLSFGSLSCSSQPSPSSVERTACSAAGRIMGAPPGSALRVIAVNLPAIVRAGDAANGPLAAASKRWGKAFLEQDQSAARQALTQMQQTCIRLGIWQVYH